MYVLIMCGLFAIFIFLGKVRLKRKFWKKKSSLIYYSQSCVHLKKNNNFNLINSLINKNWKNRGIYSRLVLKEKKKIQKIGDAKAKWSTIWHRIPYLEIIKINYWKFSK